MENFVILQCALALLLGAAIGFERESYEDRVDTTDKSGTGSLGVRSYSLIALLGAISTIVSPIHPGLFFLIALVFLAITVVYYVIGSLVTKDHGFTTELAILLTFVIGALVGLPQIPLQVTVAIAVVVAFILSIKKQVRSFVKTMRDYEISGFIAYAIIALVILPFLPNTSITITNLPILGGLLQAYGFPIERFASVEIVNPFGVWRVVAIITGVEIAGYILQKTLGQQKGWLLTSIAGGFVSSTSTTQSLALQSKKSKNSSKLVAAAIFANISSFLQMFILIASISTKLLIEITPFIVTLLISSLGMALFFSLQKEENGHKNENLENTKENLESTNIFSLAPALQFALVFMVIKIVTKVLLIIFGESGFLVGNVIASTTGLDAVIFNVSELAGNSISLPLAALALASANATNLIAKSFYSYMSGSKAFAVKFATAVAVMIIGSSLGLLTLFF
ncbi:MAG: DUF4010 domain-containing protein [Patescibacteria group bacterium]